VTNTNRRITPSQAEQAANFISLRTDVEMFLDALDAHGLMVNISRQQGIDLINAKAKLYKWVEDEDEGEEDNDEDD